MCQGGDQTVGTAGDAAFGGMVIGEFPTGITSQRGDILAARRLIFLTGSRDDINRVLKSLDATVVDKMAHEPIYIIRPPPRTSSNYWSRRVNGGL